MSDNHISRNIKIFTSNDFYEHTLEPFVDEFEAVDQLTYDYLKVQHV